MPKIFVICQHVDDEGNYIGFALAQDGTGLVQHLSSNKLWLRHDMGLISKMYKDVYDAHYPNGYELVDYLDATDEQLQEDQEFFDAYAANNQLEQELEDNA